jgi:hypothetical protein
MSAELRTRTGPVCPTNGVAVCNVIHTKAVQVLDLSPSLIGLYSYWKDKNSDSIYVFNIIQQKNFLSVFCYVQVNMIVSLNTSNVEKNITFILKKK